MPNKFNGKRWHHIPKMKFQVMNWAEYEAGLRRRGSLTLWVTDEAIDTLAIDLATRTVSCLLLGNGSPKLSNGGAACEPDRPAQTGLAGSSRA